MSEKYTLKYTGSEMDELLDGANSLSGIIVMWSGAINKIPTGWLLCDGTNGTPDLRNRFIVGAGTDYSVGNTGGTNTVTLTTAQMPSHTHTITDPGHKHDFYEHAKNKGTAQGGGDYGQNIESTTEKATTGITINATGSGQAHENRPPYYALAYIMKV